MQFVSDFLAFLDFYIKKKFIKTILLYAIKKHACLNIVSFLWLNDILILLRLYEGHSISDAKYQQL